MTENKTCTQCNKEYPLSDAYWYQNPNAMDGYQSRCKECMKRNSKDRDFRRSLTGKKKRRYGERLAVDYLNQRGIYTDFGSEHKRYKWIDIVCWGCIKIEVKYSRNLLNSSKGKNRGTRRNLDNAHGYWYFSFTSTRNKRTIMPDLIMLIMERKEHSTYHILPANHPVFFKEDGIRKKGIDYIEQKEWMFNEPDVYETVFLEYEDRIDLIEEARIKIREDLLLTAHEKKREHSI